MTDYQKIKQQRDELLEALQILAQWATDQLPEDANITALSPIGQARSLIAEIEASK